MARVQIDLNTFTTEAIERVATEGPRLEKEVLKIIAEATAVAEGLPEEELRQRIGPDYPHRTKAELVDDYVQREVKRSQPHKRRVALAAAASADRTMAERLNEMACAASKTAQTIEEIVKHHRRPQARLRLIRAELSGSYSEELERRAIDIISIVTHNPHRPPFREVLEAEAVSALRAVLMFALRKLESGVGVREGRTIAQVGADLHLVNQITSVYVDDDTMRYDLSLLFGAPHLSAGERLLLDLD